MVLPMEGFTKIPSVGFLSSGAPPADTGGAKNRQRVLLEDDLEKLVQMRFDA